MNRLTQLFTSKNRDILNVYFTAGFPKRDDTEAVILSLAASGVDLIEIGMPYSDPLADGPTIQQSGAKALENGMTLDVLFQQIKATRAKNKTIPLILMGYFNQVMQYGDRRFFENCRASGVDGLILPDLPLDVYEADYAAMLNEMDLKISFLITPQTPTDRIRRIDRLTTGFVYIVSSYAITGGASGSIAPEQVEYFQRIEKMKLKNPRLIGFGISNRSTFEIACRYANGAIIGSAFIRVLEQANTEGVENLDWVIEDFVAKITLTGSLA